MSPLRRLKFEVLVRGIAPTDRALAALPVFRRGTIVVRDYPTTSGLILALSETIYVNARLRFSRPGAFALDHDGTGFVLMDGNWPHAVTVHSPPLYALENRRLSSGRTVRAVANTHADRVRLTPFHGCAYHCRFCNYPNLAYRQNSLEEMVEGLRTALADRIMPHPHVLVSGGTPRPDESDYRHMNETCEALPSLFPSLTWDMMFVPRGLHAGRRTRRTYQNFVRRLKAWGYDAVSINMELNSDDARQRYVPEKHEVGREDYLTFLELAVETFGIGKVRSVLLIGLEPEDETLQAVEALARRGVLIELSTFVADPGTFLAQQPEPNADALARVYEKTNEIADRLGAPINPFCIPCSHNIL